MAGRMIEACRHFPASSGKGRRCTLFQWKVYSIRPAGPSSGALRGEYVTTRRRERLIIEGQGKYRSPSGVVSTSEDPGAPGDRGLEPGR
jgi:hypothetical protein